MSRGYRLLYSKTQRSYDLRYFPPLGNVPSEFDCVKYWGHTPGVLEG